MQTAVLLWLTVFLRSPAILCNLGLGWNPITFGIHVHYLVSYWIMTSFNLSLREWIRVFLKLKRVFSILLGACIYLLDVWKTYPSSWTHLHVWQRSYCYNCICILGSSGEIIIGEKWGICLGVKLCVCLQ